MRLFSHRRKVAFVLIATLGTVSGTLAMPVVTSSFADGEAPLCPGTTDPLGNCITSGETTVNVNILPMIGLYLSSTSAQGNSTPFAENSTDTSSTNGKITPSTSQSRNITFSVLPGQTATASMDARVITNASTGYNLYIETQTAQTNLTKANSSTQFTKSLGTKTSQLTTLAEGTWGVKGGDITNWIGVPAYNSGSTDGILKTGKAKNTNPQTYGPTTSTSAPSGSETTTITFGAHATTSMETGVYSGTVVITAITSGETLISENNGE
mgnify:CR=1 FL=1